MVEKSVEIYLEKKAKLQSPYMQCMLPCWRGLQFPKAAETEYTPNDISATNFNL